jgi:chromosome segregation ATPase/predicted flap endonuclease-1-like 5' DNA nuclease
MDNTMFAYLFGAFLLGFLVSWIAGRSGPKRALEDCQANGQQLQRKLDDRDRTITKTEAQVAKLQADLTGLSAEKTKADAALAAAAAQLAEVSAEAAAARDSLRDNEGELLRLRTELEHISGAWAGARARTTELTQQLETVAVMAAEAEEAAVVAEEAIAEAEAGEQTSLQQINELTAKLDVMTRELDLTRAAAERTAVVAMMRPQLTPARREEYAALAGKPDAVVSALHERDIAVADAVNENDYLRRSLGILTAMGADLAASLEKRNREYESVSARLAAAALVPTMIATRMEEPADDLGDETPADEADGADAPAAEDTVAAELQAQFEDLWTRYNAATATNGDLESQLQAERGTLDALLARLAGIGDALEALRSDADAPAEEEDAPAAPVEAEASAEADAAPVETAPASPAEGVLKRLAAGVALATSLIGRKNECVNGLVAEQADLTSGLADANTQLATLQTEYNDRSVKYDALSLHTSSLETDLELLHGERNQLEAQVRQIAAELAALADQFTPVEETPPAVAAPVAEPVVETVAEPAADAPVAEAPVADASVAEASVADEPAPSAVEEAAVAADESAPEAPIAAPSALALLTASVARIQDVVTAQQLRLADAGDRLNTLGDQLDAVNEEENALTATLADKDAALADAGQQLDTLQASLTAALAEQDGFRQRISGYHAQLSELLAQYVEPEAPADAPAAVAAEPAPGAETAADEAVAEETLVIGDEDASETDATAPAAEKSPAVDAVAAAIAAIGALFARKQANLAALSDAKLQVDAGLTEKEQALAAAATSYADLQGEFSKRSVQFDALSLRASTLEADMEMAGMARAKFERQLQAVADQLGAIATSYATPAPEAAPVAEAEPAPDAAAEAEAAAPAPKPLVAQLEDNAAAVIALVESKAAALSAAEAAVSALQQDLTTRSSEFDATSAQVSDLTAQLAAAEAAKAELENSLQEIGEQVAALRTEAADEPDEESAAPEGDAPAAEDTAENTEEVGPAAILAGISGLGLLLARRRAVVEAGKARIAELEQQVTDLTAQLQAAELDRDQIKQNLEASGAQIEALTQQVADLQAELDAATAEREGLRANIDAIGGDLDALGAAVDADDDEQVDEAVNRLVKAGLVAGGATAVVHSVRTKRAALKDADAQIEQLQQELAAATAVQAELQTRTAAQEADFTATSSQIEEMQAKLAALDAEKASVEETLQRQLEEAQVKLQDQDSQLIGMRRQLDFEAQWQRKSPFLAGLVQKLNKWSGFKATAASSALEEQVIPKTVRLPENLTDVTHIGKTYADRLHDADVGTHWELAFVPDEDLAQMLKLKELQLLGMDFEAVRASARQIALESGSVGYLWERGEYDDFEPIKGIGKVMERRLYNAGITTYAQLTELTPEQLNEICQPKPPLRPKYDSWIDQARELLAAKHAAQAAAEAAEAATEAAAEAEPPPPAAE